MPNPISLIDPKTGQVFDAPDQETAEKQMLAYGLQPAAAEDVQRYEEQVRSGTFVDKAKTAIETGAGMVAELVEQASPYVSSTGQRDYINPDAQIEDILSAQTVATKGAPVKTTAEKVAPFAFTPAAKERRRVNEDVALGTTIAADLATGFLIPGAGLPGMLTSASLSGLLTEAGSTVILDDEYSIKDAMAAGAAALAFEGVGAIGIKAALKGHSAARNYLDNTVDRMRRYASEGAEAETDVALATEKLRRNSDELYTKHQSELDEALAAIDERTMGAPERMFTPGALRKTVSENIRAQEEAYLDLAIKFDQAAEVSDVAGIADVRATLQSALGKNGAGMYEALRTARRQLDELGDVNSPLVKEAAQDLDKSLRSQPTWGKAADNYAKVADDMGPAGDTASVNVREPTARDALDQRLDRARRLYAVTGDKKLGAQLKKAEAVLERADKVTGARILGETTPDEIAGLQKKLDGFEKRAPKLAEEIRSAQRRLSKHLDGALGEMSDDEALDYVALRASGLGSKADPMRDVFVKAEKRIADMKAKGADPTKVARATADLASLRATVAEANDIPRAAQRIKDYAARPGVGSKIKQAAENVPIDEIENVLQTAMPASAATLGGVVFGIPGYIGGYLGGRLLYKRFGRKISEAAWNKAKKEIGGHAMKHPGQAATGALGAFAGGVLAHGNAAGAVGGYIAGRKAGELIGRGAKRAWSTAKRVLAEPGAPPPMGAPLGGASKSPRKAAAEARQAEKAANKAAKKAAARPAPSDMPPETAEAVNRAHHELARAVKTGDTATIKTARAAYDAVLKAARENPAQVIGGAAAVAGAALGSDDQTQTEGAAAASAGLLLLLLPRNIGRRAAFRQLEEAAQAAARRVHGTELAPVRQALTEARANLRTTLQEAVQPGAVDWTPDELIEMQAQQVRQLYADATPRGVWRAGNPPGRMSAEADAYVRAELARINAGWVNGDAALRRAYDNAAREADIAERAPRGDNPSPRVQRLERVYELQPERATRLEHDARVIRERLPSEARDLMARVFSSAQTELGALARSYVGARDTVSGLLRSADDLMAAQIEHLNETWQALRLDLPPNLSAVEIQNAAEAELRSMNAAIAQQNAPTRMVAADPVAGRTPMTLEALERRAGEAMNALPQEQRTMIARLNRHAGDEVRALRQSFLDSTPTAEGELLRTEAELLRAQWAALDNAWDAVGPGIRAEYGPMREAITLELRRGNGQALVHGSEDGDAIARQSSIEGRQEREYARRASQQVEDEGIRARIDDTIEEMARGGENMAPNLVRRRALGNVADGARADELFEADPSIARQARQASANASDSRAYKQAERERNLKHPDPAERPAMVDGIPTDAAIRLDDALHDDLERLTTSYALRQENASEALLREDLPALEERARQFVRDNPGLISDDDALGYARRRWEEIGDEEAAFRLREEGGHARAALEPEVDDEIFDDAIDEALHDQILDVDVADEYAIRNATVDTDAIVEAAIRRNDLTPRQERRLRQLADEREADWQRYMDEDLRDRHNEWRDENPDSEPESAPDSDEGHESYRTSRANYRRGSDDGLPSNEELEEIGLRALEVESNNGIENVFGRALEADEVKRIFSLEYLQKYAQERGVTASTKLTVTSRRVEFEGSSGGKFHIHQTYSAGGDGIDINYGLLKVPPEMQGEGVMKNMVTDMVSPIEGLGGGEATLSAAWVGQYTWPKLGFRPSSFAEREALGSYRDQLVRMLGEQHPAVQMSMHRIDNLRDLADAYLPAELVKERLPELRQAWEELAFKWEPYRVELQPFGEACFRTSRSGNEQFLSGKYFLLMVEGSWNNGLSLKIAPDDEWYEMFKKRLGIGAGAVGLGLSVHEIMGAFTGTDMHVSGIGGASPEREPPVEVDAYMQEHQARAAQVERTREKLGYLKTESETITRDTARAVASPTARERVVSAVPGVTASQGVARFLGTHGSLREAFEDKRETLRTIQQNPMALVEELTEGLSEVQENAPGLHAKMVQQTYKVLDFLQSKMPGTVGASLSRPEGSPTSPLAIRQFALYFSAATDPTSVMGDLANNRAQREQLETLKTLWPDVYTDLKVAVVDQLAKGRPTVAQRQRLDLLFDFGDGLDRGLSPRLVAALDAYRQQQGPGAGKGGPGGTAAPPTTPQRRSQPSVRGTGALGALALGPAAGPGTLA